MKLFVPYEKINPISPFKDETLIGLALGTIALGVHPEPNSDRTTVMYTADNDKLPLEVADMIASKGVVITNFPLFIEIESKDGDNAFGVVDEEGNTLTWAEWKLSNHTFYEADGHIFIGTNAGNNEDMDWADLAPIRASLVLPSNLPQGVEEVTQ